MADAATILRHIREHESELRDAFFEGRIVPECPKVVVSTMGTLGGTPRFARVPLGVLFENLADGPSLDDICNDYPTLGRDVAIQALWPAHRALEQRVLAELERRG